MVTIKRFEEINAWKEARILTREIYQRSSQGQFSRDYPLRDQLRRSSISIMSNISEGFESQANPLFIKYLGLAKASAGEVRSQLYIAFDLGYLSDIEFKSLKIIVENISGQLFGFIKYLKSQKTSNRI